MIDIRDLTYRQEDKLLFNEISLRFEGGTVHGILGPNGVGKSTLLKLIAGDIRSFEGSCYLKKKPLSDYSLQELAGERSVLLQENHFAFSMTVEEVCTLGRSASAESVQESILAVERALQAMDLLELKNRQFTDLSGGEKQRLHIARVLCQGTDLLLLDEPLNSLDIKYQLKFLKLLSEKAKEGKTILVVMHDINLLLRYSDTLTLLSNAKVLFHDVVSELKSCEVLEQVFGVPFSMRLEGEKPQVDFVIHD